MFVVYVGNPFDGGAIYGPFESPDETEEWAMKNLLNLPLGWCSVKVVAPESIDRIDDQLG